MITILLGEMFTESHSSLYESHTLLLVSIHVPPRDDGTSSEPLTVYRFVAAVNLFVDYKL